MYSSTMKWRHQRKGEVGVAEGELPAAFRGRTLPAAPAHVGPTPMDVSVPEGQAPLVALGPPGPPVPPPGLPAPGLPPAQVAAIVEALASSQAFAAAIAARVFATPASAAAELDEVVLAPGGPNGE